jgi:hypothetical protein
VLSAVILIPLVIGVIWQYLLNQQGSAGLLFGGALLVLGAVTYELWSVPRPEWLPRAIGSNSIACLLSISFLSLAPLGGAFYALRQAAREIFQSAGLIRILLSQRCKEAKFGEIFSLDFAFFAPLREIL